ncbi:hypothetical protein HK097_003110 [Rhizophlyctis rosea]|uniref:Methyltransferase domain-containing protein n=1 Tax=Rhizophlyctis rosea TaxID=64517 RepID=A0AAD5X0T1_9FUNG|nr:hypothetical protein HK097_003110 [Rhizophlyctis rosea]
MGDRTPEGWSTHAPVYEKSTRKVTGLFSYEALLASGVLPPQQHAQKLQILDTATGTGILPLQLAENYTAAGLASEVKVTATDFAPGMIDILDKRIQEKGFHEIIRTKVADAQDLQTTPATITHAYMIFGIFFLPSPQTALRNLHTSLRTTGTLTLTSWGHTDLLRLSKEIMRRLNPSATVTYGGTDVTQNWSSVPFIAGLLKEAGFRSVEGKEVEKEVEWNTYDELIEAIIDNPGIAERFEGKEEVKKKWVETALGVLKEWWPGEPFRMKMPGLIVVARK